MSRTRDNVVPHAKVRSLREAIRKVKFAEVERTDVVIELQESERARLELLCEELTDVFKEVPEDDDQFSFQIVPGNIPRLWIDITSHVAMGRDKRVYRFVKDTRLGRTVILETADLEDMADCITEYIAERAASDPPPAATSLARLQSSVRGMHRFLVVEGIDPVDPTTHVRPPKMPRRLPKALTIAQVEALLAAARKRVLEAFAPSASRRARSRSCAMSSRSCVRSRTRVSSVSFASIRARSRSLSSVMSVKVVT